MQITRAAAAGADGQFSGQMGFGAGGEGRALLMAHMDPLDGSLTAQRVGKSVERIADDAIDALDAGFSQSLRHKVCRCAHFGIL
jgi:hypothetical protein